MLALFEDRQFRKWSLRFETKSSTGTPASRRSRASRRRASHVRCTRDSGVRLPRWTRTRLRWLRTPWRRTPRPGKPQRPARGPGVATRCGTPAPWYPVRMQAVQLASRTSGLPPVPTRSPRFPLLSFVNRAEPEQSRRPLCRSPKTVSPPSSLFRSSPTSSSRLHTSLTLHRRSPCTAFLLQTPWPPTVRTEADSRPPCRRQRPPATSLLRPSPKTRSW
jgi:hypothetical protein